MSYRDNYNREVSDIDHDGAIEVAIAPDGFGAIDMFRDQGAGSYGVCTVEISKKNVLQKPQCVESTEAFPAETVAVGDFNGDGIS